MTGYCSCKPGHKVGWKHLRGEWWVCSQCEMATLEWMESVLAEVDATLQLFRHGPRHNELWTGEDILAGAAWITQYVWTDEVVVGSESGRVARIWVHFSKVPEEVRD